MGKLYIVGVGSGNYKDLSIRADEVLSNSEIIFCDEKLYSKIYKRYGKKLTANSYTATRQRCTNAVECASHNKTTAILGSGDTGVYGISALVLSIVESTKLDINIEVIPGITSAISGASLLGAPLTQDFAVISLSDNFTKYNDMKRRIVAAAKTDFVIVFYSPCNPSNRNLLEAKKILLRYRSPNTVVGIAQYIGSENERIKITYLNRLETKDIDSYCTVFIGKSNSRMTENGKMITPLC